MLSFQIRTAMAKKIFSQMSLIAMDISRKLKMMMPLKAGTWAMMQCQKRKKISSTSRAQKLALEAVKPTYGHATLHSQQIMLLAEASTQQ